REYSSAPASTSSRPPSSRKSDSPPTSITTLTRPPTTKAIIQAAFTTSWARSGRPAPSARASAPLTAPPIAPEASMFASMYAGKTSATAASARVPRAPSQYASTRRIIDCTRVLATDGGTRRAIVRRGGDERIGLPATPGMAVGVLATLAVLLIETAVQVIVVGRRVRAGTARSCASSSVGRVSASDRFAPSHAQESSEEGEADGDRRRDANQVGDQGAADGVAGAPDADRAEVD